MKTLEWLVVILGLGGVTWVTYRNASERARESGAPEIAVDRPQDRPRQPKVRLSKAASGDQIAMKKDHTGCRARSDLSDMARFAAADDQASFRSYLRSGRCKMFSGRETGTKAEQASFGHEARVVIDGTSWWVPGDSYSP